jgi:hypothetical protein
MLMNNHITAITLTNTLRLLNVARNPRKFKLNLGSDVAISLAGTPNVAHLKAKDWPATTEV